MASRSLGTLTLDLVARIGGFTGGLSKAEREAEKRFAGINAAAKKMGIALGATLAAAGAGAAAALKATIDRMDEMSKSAARVGLNTEDFSRLAYAGELADVSMEALVGSLGKLTKAQAAALKDTSEQARVFDALGISVKNADGSLRSSNDVLLDFADRFKALDGSPEAMAAGFSLFGRSFQELIPLLKDGSAGLRDAAAESDALGKTLSTETGRAAEEVNDNITRLQSAIGGAWMEIAQGMLPNLNKLTGELVSAAKETDNLRQFGDGLATVLGTIGKSFSFVAGMARQFGVDMATAIDAASGWAEITKNIASLGIADGTVAGGFGRIQNAKNTRAQIMADAQRDRAAAAAAANIDLLLANGTGVYNGPLLTPSKSLADAELARKVAEIKEARAQAEALRKALGDPDPKARPKTSTGAGKSDAQRQAEEAIRAAQRAAEAQERWRGTVLDLEATLSGPLAVAEREYTRNTEQLTAAFHSGEVALADYVKGMDAYKAQRDAEIKTINDRKTPAQEMLADMQFEAELIGKTREEQELLNAARWLGAEAATEQGKAALAAMKENQEALRSFGEQAAFMDGVRDEFNDFFMDVFTGTKSIKDAFKDLFDGIAQMITQKIVDGWLDKLFGGRGTTGAGTQGGNWISSILGFFGFGGANANGNAFQNGSVIPFANGGVVTAPQFFPMSGGRAGLMGEAGPEAIMPLTRIGGKLGVRASGGGMTVNQTINVPRNTEYRNASQVGQAALVGFQRAAARNR